VRRMPSLGSFSLVDIVLLAIGLGVLALNIALVQ
jgi:hypothetical protein